MVKLLPTQQNTCCWCSQVGYLHLAEEQQSRGKHWPEQEDCWRQKPGIFLTSASLPPKILPFLLAIPQRHSGTQSRDAAGNGLTTNSEVLEEWSSWLSWFQEYEVGLNSAILEGASFFESLPPKARTRSPIFIRAYWIRPRDCCKSRTLTTSPDADIL